ncbi:MAG: hypothetical protein RL757_2890 [Bacteroidota bacterium]|jgi:hypothetical protein
MSFEIVGKLYRKFPAENKSQTFQTREFVIEIMDGNYPQVIRFQLVQDRCSQLDPFNEGEEIKVYFDLRGREWNGKFLTNLNAWRIERGGAADEKAVPAANQAPAADAGFPTIADAPIAPAADDDLPF